MRIRRLVMLRHGQTEYNAGSRMQGQLDTELSDLGREQAVAAAEVLAKRQPLVIVSSDLRRALDTAVALGERSGQPVLVDTRLRETHLGDWQGMTHLEVDASAPGARLAWRDNARWAPHGGESRVDVAARSMPLVAELIAAQTEWGVDEPERPVVLVAHGGLIAALTAALLELPVDNWPVLGGMGNASWVQLSGHSKAGRVAGRSAGASTCGTPRHRSPTMSSDRRQADPARLLRLAVLLRAHRRAARRRSANLAEYRCQPTGLGRRADRADRLDLSRRVVGRHPGSAGVGGAAAGRRGDLRDRRHGLAAVAAAHRAARTDPLRAAAVASALGARRLRLGAAAVLADRARRPAAAPVRRVPRNDPRCNRLQSAGHTDRGVAAVGAHRRDLRQGAPRPRRHRQGDHRMGGAARRSAGRSEGGRRRASHERARQSRRHPLELRGASGRRRADAQGARRGRCARKKIRS